MAKLVKCKACGQDIAKSAKRCPYCGAKRRKGPAIVGSIVIILCVIVLLAIGLSDNSDGPTKVADTPSAQAATAQPNSATQNVFGVGDMVKLNNVIVTLVGVDESRGGEFMEPDEGKVFLICEFEIENASDQDITVSSLLSFEAYVDDYATMLDISATVSADKQQLDGSIAAGKKMNGVVGYAVDADWSELEIRFMPDFVSGKEIVFQYSK